MQTKHVCVCVCVQVGREHRQINCRKSLTFCSVRLQYVHLATREKYCIFHVH